MKDGPGHKFRVTPQTFEVLVRSRECECVATDTTREMDRVESWGIGKPFVGAWTSLSRECERQDLRKGPGYGTSRLVREEQRTDGAS